MVMKTPMQTIPVDPVHFFDAHAKSYLSRDHLERRIEKLEKENERLTLLLQAWQIRAKLTGIT